MRKYTLPFAILLFLSNSIHSQVNLIEDWDGNGDNDISTSYPDNYGWDVTVGEFNYANSGGGVRYTDVSSGHYLNGSTYVGRLLMVRWDGSGSTTLESVFSYPVTLEANKKYSLDFIYEWWNNASAPVLTFGIGSNKDGSVLLHSEDFACSSTRQVLLEGNMSFYSTTAGQYYLTIKANNLAALCAVGELIIEEQPSVLEATVSSVVLNYYEAEKTFSVYPNGSSDPIQVSVPEGIGVSGTDLPSTGGEVRIYSVDSTNASGNITITQGADEITIPVSANFPESFINEVDFEVLTADGAWCWFNDPRAIYHEGSKKQTYFSWIDSKGDVYIASYNHESGEYLEHILYPNLEVDDHDNPAIFIRDDGHLVVYFSKHTTAPAHRFISTNPEDITSWGSDYRFGENVTYPYPFKVGDDIYVFYRGLDWHPTLIISKDGGESMGDPMQFITGGGARPYARYCQDNTGAIHCAFTTAHPRNDANNKIYYAKFQDGKFYRADGILIKEYTGTATALNIDTNEPETVYDASIGKGWIWDITVDENNNPVMVFASFPTDLDHRYHYARWTGSDWYLSQITQAGKWFPQTPAGANEPEPNYSGGVYLDPDDPSKVFLSKEVKETFEIFQFTTPDGGITWDSTALTWGTDPEIVNVRPIVPRNHKKGLFDLIWMRGKYTYYTNYHTSLVFWSDSVVNELYSIDIEAENLTIGRDESMELNVSYLPYTTELKDLTWTSSDESIVIVEDGVITGKSTGTATIYATGHNNVKDSVAVTVILEQYMSYAYFDFGTASSPLISGATRISGTTMFNGEFGWQTSVLVRDRGTGTSDDKRDFNMSSSDAVFSVKMTPGRYTVQLIQGDQSYPHDNMNTYVNGELKAAKKASATGGYASSEFIIETSEPTIDFRFSDGGGSDVNWVINSLKIIPVGIRTNSSEIPAFSAYVNQNDSYSLDLSASNLSANIYLSITGDNASMFSVNPETISVPTSGEILNSSVSVKYQPSEEGEHTAILNIESGSYKLQLSLNGNAAYMPLMIASTDSINLMRTHLNETATETIMIITEHLASDVDIYFSGPDSMSFAANPDAILMTEDDNSESTNVTISYNPESGTEHAASLHFKTDNLDDLVFNVKGSVIPASVSQKTTVNFTVFASHHQLMITGVNNYQVYTAAGKKIAEVNSASDVSTIDVQPGVYIVKSGIVSKKAIVQ